MDENSVVRRLVSYEVALIRQTIKRPFIQGRFIGREECTTEYLANTPVGTLMYATTFHETTACTHQADELRLSFISKQTVSNY
jgi:hypothetical protein